MTDAGNQGESPSSCAGVPINFDTISLLIEGANQRGDAQEDGDDVAYVQAYPTNGVETVEKAEQFYPTNNVLKRQNKLIQLIV